MEERKRLRKRDFVELEYIGKLKDTGLIFDTNIEEEAKKINLNIKTRPLIICLGENMILKAIDDFLIDKEVGKKYSLDLKPENAFGRRSRELIKTMPLSVFSKHNVKPEQGMIFTFDNLIGKISAVSGGRVIVDFNNPLANKDVLYELNIKRIVKGKEEKVKALMLFLFKREFDFKIKQKKLEIEAKEEEKRFLEFFKDKFKEILDLELEVKQEKEEKK